MIDPWTMAAGTTLPSERSHKSESKVEMPATATTNDNATNAPPSRIGKCQKNQMAAVISVKESDDEPSSSGHQKKRTELSRRPRVR